MARTISQRELRNDSAKIIRELQDGETFVLTNHGVPVGELRPLHGPRRGVPRDELVAAFADLPPVDAAAWIDDIDASADQTISDPYLREPD